MYSWYNSNKNKNHLKNQNEKAAYCIIPTIGHPAKGKTMVAVKAPVDANSWEKEKMNRQSTEDF
jgi:hypothetical protein